MPTLFCVHARTRAPCPYIDSRMGDTGAVFLRWNGVWGTNLILLENVDANVVLRAYEDTGAVSLRWNGVWCENLNLPENMNANVWRRHNAPEQDKVMYVSKSFSNPFYLLTVQVYVLR